MRGSTATRLVSLYVRQESQLFPTVGEVAIVWAMKQLPLLLCVVLCGCNTPAASPPALSAVDRLALEKERDDLRVETSRLQIDVNSAQRTIDAYNESHTSDDAMNYGMRILELTIAVGEAKIEIDANKRRIERIVKVLQGD